MLKEAGRFAVQAKDVALAFQVIEEMASRFKVDAFDLQVKSLTAICKGSLPQQQTSTVAGQALALAEEALTKEEFDTAKQLGTLATEAARKSRDAAFIKETGSRTRAIAKEPAELREAQAGVEEAVAVLEKSAIDTAANLTLGKYRCFLKNLWSEGLPMLALGDDPTLKDLAARELKGVTDPAEQAKLGDGWWGVGEEKTGLAQRNIQAHAGNWYQDALPGLTGLVKEKTEKRLRESPCQVLAERMTGDLVQFISLEPNNNEFSRTGVIGGTWGSPYEDFPHPRCLLVGFHITTSSTSEKTPVAKSVQPVYVGPGRTTGSRVYAKAEGKTITVEAMKGYAVAGIVGRGGTKVDGFKVIFMRVGRTSLDRRHSYESDWIGGQGGGEEKKLGGDGRPVVGIYGKCGDDLNSLGLIQAKSRRTGESGRRRVRGKRGLTPWHKPARHKKKHRRHGACPFFPQPIKETGSAGFLFPIKLRRKWLAQGSVGPDTQFTGAGLAAAMIVSSAAVSAVSWTKVQTPPAGTNW